ncbi:hypothetical protein C0V97_07030 [Asaia sp. W19]|nr:hypothetical protein C0V97_18000 [Asaia sp. W19]RUT26290.1 hypothetical protein C0V97_07030 [Asaia sp. W19]
MAGEEAPQRAGREMVAVIGQAGTDISEGQVVLRRNHRMDPPGMRLDPIGQTISATRPGRRTAGRSSQSAPANGARRINPLRGSWPLPCALVALRYFLHQQTTPALLDAAA